MKRSILAKYVLACAFVAMAWVAPALGQPEQRGAGCAEKCNRDQDCVDFACSLCVEWAPSQEKRCAFVFPG